MENNQRRKSLVDTYSSDWTETLERIAIRRDEAADEVVESYAHCKLFAKLACG
jgi:hypothetical protein